MKKASDIRQEFLDFFAGHGHTVVPSSLLIPQADPTLLFTNAGMVQFKGVFLGQERRAYARAVSVQKCMRAGGKHNDLDQVGWTGRHHTFFEMLGNFSFGDYFKAEAIDYGWELLTKRWGLPLDQLWVTVFREDDEAEALWKKIGVPAGRIIRKDEADNFWQMGETGPCGPCSEIHIDRGEHAAPPEHRAACRGIHCDCDRFLEIWNLVFMQFNRDASGSLAPLPKPSIDTGMGLERIAAVIQGAPDNYHTDLFTPYFHALAGLTGRDVREVSESRGGRVIADHIRAMTFLISDGVLPSNEGRGYVLRRVVRRAVRYGRELGFTEPFLHRLSATAVETMVGAYPELAKSRSLVAEALQVEEERFLQVLDEGMGRWREVIQQAESRRDRTIAGAEAFRLYDTYGFPLDIAVDMARERGLAVDSAGFDAAMEEQRDRARKAWVVKTVEPYFQELLTRVDPTRFTGYDRLDDEVRLLLIIKDGRPVKSASAGEEVELVFDQTPFYGESGGQVGDQGLLEHPGALAEIIATVKPLPGFFVHRARVTSGVLREGETCRAVVNRTARSGAASNHTATHLLHATLRELFGERVKQAGSLVAADRLRFDFTLATPLQARDLRRVEQVVNDRIRGDYRVQTQEMAFHDAVKAGALAFFDDKYGDRVRVVRIGEFSKELCGGTHCHDTGEVGLFRVVQESSIAAGVRRIEAITGEAAYTSMKRQEEDLDALAALLKVAPADVVERARKMMGQLREQERELERLKGNAITSQASTALDQSDVVNGVTLLVQRVDGLDPKALRQFADSVRDRMARGVLLVGSVLEGKVALVAMVTKGLTEQFHAGRLLQTIAPIVGGSGGGRPDMAQAGGKLADRLDEALRRGRELLSEEAGRI
ncbi:MAG TPA: alanine--tRNA ligase [Nitrospiria bacterium]|nr:alanine--tRNA ligase [Nitrospiria bacterium]